MIFNYYYTFATKYLLKNPIFMNIRIFTMLPEQFDNIKGFMTKIFFKYFAILLKYFAILA